MDKLNIGVTVDANSAVDSLSKVTAAIDKVDASTKRMSISNLDAAKAIAKNEVESRRFLAALNEEVNTLGKGRAGLMEFRAAQLGVTAQSKAMIDEMKRMDASGIKSAGAAMEEMSFKTVGAKRELLVLAHELSQGNFKRAAGSAMVLGERVNVMGALFSVAGLSIGAAVGVVAGFVIAAANGAAETINLRNSLKMTNDYAGITAAQFDTLAGKISTISGEKIGNARDALQSLVSTGRFSGKSLEYLGEAVVKMERLTGQSSDEVVKDFSRMSDGVAKWVAEHNQSMHFATLAQYQYIQQLEDAGKKEQAYIEVAKLLDSQTSESVKSLGSLERGWRGITSAISGAWDAMKGIGRNDPSESLAKQIASLEHDLNARTGRNGAGGLEVTGKDRAGKEAWLASLQAQQKAGEDAKKHKSEQDTIQENGIKAAARGKEALKELGGSASLARLEIEKLHTTMAEILAANPNDKTGLDMQANMAKLEAGARKKYDKTDFKSARKIDSAYDSTMQSLGADKAKLTDEIAQFKELGTVVDKSKLAVLNFSIANGDLKGLSAGRAKNARGAASADDALAANFAELKGIKAIEEKIKSLKDETAAIGEGKAATKESTLLSALDSEKTITDAKAHDKLKDAIHDAVLENEKANAQVSIKAGEKDTAQRIAKLKEESDLVGKSVLERQKMAAADEIHGKAAKEKRAFPSQADAIDASAAQQIIDFNKQLDTSNEKIHSWDAGVKSAMKDYSDSARDAAGQSKKLFADAFNGMEDALVNFLEHGKMSFKSLFTSIENDLAHIAAKKMMAGLFGGPGFGGGAMGGIGSILGPMFGGSGAMGGLFGATGALGSNAGVAASQGLTMMDIAGAFAGGGDPPVGQASLVGEQGPELFVPKVPGTVIPNGQFNSGSGATVHYSPVINIDSRTDQAQIHQLVSRSVAQGNADLVDHLQRSGKI